LTGSDSNRVLVFSRETLTRRSTLGLLAGGLAAVAWGDAGARKKHRSRKQASRVGAEAAGRATQRPIADFLDAQGTTNQFIPPVPDFVGWGNNNPATRFASVDYAGLANGYLVGVGYPDLGTKTSGKVTELELKDGRARVSVVLHTTNALSWALKQPITDIATDPLSFGYRPAELLADEALDPALGDSEFSVEFNNTAPGAPLPDLIVAFIVGPAEEGQELLKLSFRASAAGDLREPSGFPEGTSGHLTIVQTGLVYKATSPDQPPHPAVADGFPAERVEWRKVGAGATKN
jgi:hypothetical protein